MEEQEQMKKLLIIGLAMALVLTFAPLASAQQVDEWSQYQKDVKHGGAIDIDVPITNQIARRTTAISAVDGSQPVVAGDKAFVYSGVAGTSGAIYCFSLTTGTQLWTTPVTAMSSNVSWASPAVADGVVYIGSGSKVHALDAEDGSQLWAKDLTTIKAAAEIVNSSPAIDGNRLIIGDWKNGCYYCLDISQSGKLLWTFNLDSGCLAQSTGCVDNGRVFVGQAEQFGQPLNGKVWCIDESTGNKVTSWGTNGYYATTGELAVTGSVTCFGNFIYFTDFVYGPVTEPNCKLYCLSKTNGAENWKKSVYGSDGAPAVVRGKVVTAGEKQAAWPEAGVTTLTAFSADTDTGTSATQLWTKSGVGGMAMSPCIGDDKIAVGNEISGWPPITATDTSVLKLSDGSKIWNSSEGGSPPVATPYGLLSIGDGKMITFGTGSLPNGDFYFAEGTTRSGYQEWISLENPTDATVKVNIDYMHTSGDVQKELVDLPPNSRTTIDVSQTVWDGEDISVHAYGDGYFIAERAMYFKANGLNGGEQVMGVSSPVLRTLFAEGTTRSGFQTWVAIQNPQEQEANVLVTYLYADGSDPVQQNMKVPAKSRQTVDVNVGAGAEKDVSIVVTANRPVVAERVMYFTYPGTVLGGHPSGVHNSTGVSAPGNSWYFAEGTTRSNFNEYICLMNPGGTEATATITYMKSDGETVPVQKKLPANSRTTVNAADDVGLEQDISALVTCPQAIVAERPMYFKYVTAEGSHWKGGHDSAGAPYAAYRWELAEGCTRDGFNTFICIANPNADEVEVQIDYFVVKATGGSETRTQKVAVAGQSRQTVMVNDVVGPGADVSASVSCAKPIIVERPMYFSFSGYTDGGCSPGYPGAL